MCTRIVSPAHSCDCVCVCVCVCASPQAGIQAMWSISVFSPGVEKLKLAGACDMLMSCLRPRIPPQTPDDARVVNAGLAVILNMSYYKSAGADKAFDNVEACSLALSCLAKNAIASDAGVIYIALRTLEVIANRNAEATKQLVAADACKLVLACLREHEDDEKIASQVLRVMKMLLENKTAIAQLDSAGAVATIDAVIARHSDDDMIPYFGGIVKNKMMNNSTPPLTR